MHEKYSYGRLLIFLCIGIVILAGVGYIAPKFTKEERALEQASLTLEQKLQLLMQPDASATTSEAIRDEKMKILQQPDASRSQQNVDNASRPQSDVDAEIEAKLKILQEPN